MSNITPLNQEAVLRDTISDYERTERLFTRLIPNSLNKEYPQRVAEQHRLWRWVLSLALP